VPWDAAVILPECNPVGITLAARSGRSCEDKAAYVVADGDRGFRRFEDLIVAGAFEAY